MSAFSKTEGVENVSATLRSRDSDKDYISLNAELEKWGTDESGRQTIQYDSDHQAARQFFLDHVNPNLVNFLDLEEKINFLVDNDYYEREFLDKYDFAFVKRIFKHIYGKKFRFSTFVGAYKYFNSYSLMTFDGKRYLERFEDRVCIVALYIAQGDEEFAWKLAEEMISGRFQPATPTFLNAGKKQRGELVSCFLLNVGDDLNSIMRSVNSAAQLSKRGGGVALNLTSVRGKGDPIKKIENQASGVVPIMKILEDTFSYANQLGARQGAGAVYLNAHHIDIEDFLDTKRENADEKVRIKSLSLGVVIPDITFELARNGEKMYLFSPYDLEQEYGKEMAWLNISDIYREAVENPRIRKTSIDPRDFLTTLTEIQMESGYPYIIFEDAANRANNVGGKIVMSNLCVEILQPQEPSVLNDDQTYAKIGKDISCNLGSLNFQRMLESPDFGNSVETAIRTLSIVSDMSYIDAVPTVAEGNRRSHAVGLGLMGLAGSYAKNHIYYGDEESLDLANVFLYNTLFHAIRASNEISKDKAAAGLTATFEGFENSKYATGEFFEKFINPTHIFTPQTEKVKAILAESNIVLPTPADWAALAASVKEHGIYNSHLMAIPPTGSISYVNHATPSTLPVTSTVIEKRTEGRMGTVFVPNAYAEGNEDYYSGHNMYEIDPKKVIDVNSVIQFYVDQSISLTLGYKSTVTTKDVTKNIIYAFSKGKPAKKTDERSEMLAKYPSAEIKSLYYVRVNNIALEGTQQDCVSCML